MSRFYDRIRRSILSIITKTVCQMEDFLPIFTIASDLKYQNINVYQNITMQDI